MRYALLILGFIMITETSSGLNKAQRNKLKFYQDLMKKLKYVIPRKELKRLILDRRVKFNQSLIMLNLDQPSVKKYVAYALGRKALSVGYSFLKKHEKALNEIEKRYRVDREVIVAILYIETNFNPAKANYNVFNAYANLTFADHPYYLKKNLQRLRWKYRFMSREYYKIKERDFIKGSRHRAKWALEELMALYKLSKKLNKPILDIKGSFAGAIGYPQFIPSSYMTYAVDGSGDNYVDLFNIHDSMASIGNYLKTEGFRMGNPKSQKTAIHHYNKSWDYVHGVMEYARRLKVMSGRPVRKRKR